MDVDNLTGVGPGASPVPTVLPQDLEDTAADFHPYDAAVSPINPYLRHLAYSSNCEEERQQALRDIQRGLAQVVLHHRLEPSLRFWCRRLETSVVVMPESVALGLGPAHLSMCS